MAKITVMSINKEIASIIDRYDLLKHKVDLNRFNNKLDSQEVIKLFEMLDEQIVTLASNTPSGKEDINDLAEAIHSSLNKIEKTLDGEFLSSLKNQVSDLNYQLDIFNYVLKTGKNVDLGPKMSPVRKKLMDQFNIASEICAKYYALRNQKEEEILRIEAEKAEILDRMCDEENERILNQLTIAHQAKEREVDEKQVYSDRLYDCYEILRSILENSRFILDTASDKSESMKEAESILDVRRYQDMITKPEKALVALKMIDEKLAKLRKSLLPTSRKEEKPASVLTPEAKALREKALAQREAKKLAGKVKSLDNLEEKKEEEQQDSTVVNK